MRPQLNPRRRIRALKKLFYSLANVTEASMSANISDYFAFTNRNAPPPWGLTIRDKFDSFIKY